MPAAFLGFGTDTPTRGRRDRSRVATTEPTLRLDLGITRNQFTQYRNHGLNHTALNRRGVVSPGRSSVLTLVAIELTTGIVSWSCRISLDISGKTESFRLSWKKSL